MLRRMSRGWIAWCAASSLVACAATSDDATELPPAPPPPPAETTPAAAPPVVGKGETGFVDVPRQSGDGDPAPARLFYAYREADTSPETKPLFLVFNGGPGGTTTSGLLVSGTGPYVVQETTGGATVVPNPAGLTRLGNVLWVDERMTGFSYDTAKMSKRCTFDPAADAADYVRVLTAFVAAHPELARSKLVVVGESYGGLRASTIVYQLLHPEAPGGVDVSAEVTRFLGGEATPARVTERVLGLALVQPFVLGQAQLDAQKAEADAMRAQYPDKSPYDVRLTLPPAQDDAPAYLLRAMGDPEKSKLIFGVDIASTPRLGPADRVGAARIDGVGDVFGRRDLDNVLTARLGALATGDRYYDEVAQRCDTTGFEAKVTPTAFVETLRTVPVLVTDAKYDAVIRSPRIWDTLEKLGYAVDATSKPGFRVVTLPASGALPAAAAAVRFPSYEAGHSVPATAAPAFTGDVEAWLAQLSAPKK